MRDSVDYFTRIAAEEMADNPAFNDVRREMLEESLLYYQDFLEEQAGNAPLGAELIATRTKISALLDELTTADALARSGYRVSLLSEPAVREDLQLSDKQITRADGLSVLWNDGRPDASARHNQQLGRARIYLRLRPGTWNRRWPLCSRQNS